MHCAFISMHVDVPKQYVGSAKSEGRALEEKHRKSEEQRKGRRVRCICCQVQGEEARAGRLNSYYCHMIRRQAIAQTVIYSQECTEAWMERSSNYFRWRRWMKVPCDYRSMCRHWGRIRPCTSSSHLRWGWGYHQPQLSCCPWIAARFRGETAKLVQEWMMMLPQYWRTCLCPLPCPVELLSSVPMVKVRRSICCECDEQ